MDVKQIYEFTNTATKEAIGEVAVLNEDLSNIVDIGTEIFNANAVDKYVKALVNQIGKVAFVNRVYKGIAPSTFMSNWEFGSVMERIQVEMPEAKENESWQLENLASYDYSIFYQPKVSAKFFNSKTTFEVDISFTELQVKQSFTSADQLNSFLSMIFTSVDNSITIKNDELIMKTINNMIAETIYDDYGSLALSTKSGVKAINLLKLYNDKFGKKLTLDTALTDMDFIKYASYTIKLYATRIKRASTLFNIDGKVRFTPEESLHLVMLADFKDSADVYLQSDTFHNELTKLPNAESVPYWQGSGTDYALASTSKIDVKTTSGNSVSTTGILAFMFDRWALGVTNMNRRTTSSYNPKAEFYTNYSKVDASYFNDFSQNGIVFGIW